MVLPAPINRTKELVNDLLDRGYDDAVSATIRAVLRGSTEGVMETRLRQFEDEARRLQEAGQPLTVDNPVFRALMADFEDVLRQQARRVDNTAGDVQASGADAGVQMARQLTLPGLDDADLARIGIRWNVPNPEAIAQVVQYASSAGWEQELAAYTSDIWQHVNFAAIRGIIDGQNPLTTAREIAALVENLPLSRANNLMRTLQLTSYRDATSATYVANADILTGQIRIATLDARCCMACVSLHGTELAIGERIDDHHQGRCTSIGIVRGQRPSVQSGEEWFAGLSEERQREQMGHAAFEAWQAGQIQLRDFVQPYNDRVFGSMLREASLRGMLGDAAAGFYTRPPGSAPPTTPVRGPSGTPVSSAFGPQGGKLGGRLQNTLNAIDEVHGDGTLPQIPINIGTSRTRRGSYYHDTRGNAQKIIIQRSGAHSDLTLAHEIGHFLDQQGLQGPTRGYWWPSADASRGNGPLTEWWNAVTNSEEYKLLTDMRNNPSAYTRREGDFTWRPDTRYISYALNPKELWARSYAQYIAERSGNPAMMEQVNEVVDPSNHDRLYNSTQWTRESFAPIGDAIDNAFANLGWRR